MIETVKIQSEGYLVNGGMSVPKADGNRHYQAVKEFIAEGGVVELEFSATDLLAQEHAEFRSDRDVLLAEADILINMAFDNDIELLEVLKVYRQELRDATATWVMPSKPSGV